MSNLAKKRLSVFGGGNMGGALVRGLVAANPEAAGRITVCDPGEEVRLKLKTECGVNVVEDPLLALDGAEILILAVKPKIVPEVLRVLSRGEKLSGVSMIISVVAGVNVASIKKGLASDIPVTRVMPNLPCTIGKGITAVYSENEQDSLIACELFQTTGDTVVVRSEDEIDIATAVSGSGPAFVFSVIDAIAEGGVACGMSRDTALKLAASMVEGSAVLLKSSDENPAELVRRVATPGGTTEKGLNVLESADIKNTFVRAIEAATARAREISTKE